MRTLSATALILAVALFSRGVAAQSTTVSGSITANGNPVANAQIDVLGAERIAVAAGHSDENGNYRIPVPSGTYELRVTAAGFATLRKVVTVGSETRVDIRLTVAGVPEEITVTAAPGRVEEIHTVAQGTNVIPLEEIALRSKTVTAQVAAEEPGAHLQRTSPTLGGIYVRGLTGNKVNVFVDGVRYSTAAARGGINTFLNLVAPESLDTVEILRGPSAQYGSDALGGSVQLLTAAPSLSSGAGSQVRGAMRSYASSADASFGSALQLSYAGEKIGAVTNFSGKRVNTLRTGDAIDSHSAVTRFLGLPSTTYYDRVQDSAFTQYAGSARVNWAVRPDTQIVAHYLRGQQDGGRRPDQLLAGDGNLVADLRNLMLDLFYVRLESQQLRWFDRAGIAYSYNSQREERVNQGGGGSPTASITHEPERTSVHGVQGNAGKRIGRHDALAGAEFYTEHVNAPSYAVNPVNGVSSVRRGRVPDEAQYRSGGIFAQDIVEVVPQTLRLTGSLRWSVASYRASSEDAPVIGGSPAWPDDSMRVDDLTYRAGAVVTPVQWLTATLSVARGFRAPHITDLGTLGLTGSGFEVAAPDVAGLGAILGSSAARDAVSTGIPVAQIEPETSLAYEGSLRFRAGRVDATVAGFVNYVHDNITKQALILPAGAVGTTIAGEPIIEQTPTGTVFVAASSTPVLVRANFDDAKIWGIETQASWNMAARWRAEWVSTYIRSRDERTGLAPNIEGGTPAPDAWLKLRYTSRSWWIEPYLHGALRQERLSSLDLEDRRTGATRSRSSISRFFNNGAAARGMVRDGILLATGETLAQVQARVLGTQSSAPLFPSVAGYLTLNVRGSYSLTERQRVIADFENITDRNYRGISWGIEAPGRNLTLQYVVNF